MGQFASQFETLSDSVRIREGILSCAGDELGPVLGGKSPKIAVISDANVMALHGQALSLSLKASGMEAIAFEVPPGDGSKSLDSAAALFRFFAGHRLDRDAMVIALGGGMVSDLAGFVAATWMRGIRWVVCPTTLEAQIDAAIGGKTAVNIPGGKNLVGAFHPPILTLIDPLALGTLPERDFRSGLAESVKHAAVFWMELFEWHEANSERIMRREPEIVGELIRRNVQLKCEVVQRDPYERSGQRILLNFGHTVGHAIEEASQYTLRHGECVALGMIAAARISNEMGLLPASEVGRLSQLLTGLGLPTSCELRVAPEEILAIASRDKKSEAGRIRFVLLKALGQPVIRADVARDLLLEVCHDLLAGSQPRM